MELICLCFVIAVNQRGFFHLQRKYPSEFYWDLAQMYFGVSVEWYLSCVDYVGIVWSWRLFEFRAGCRWSLKAIKSFAMAELEARKLNTKGTGTEALLLGILLEGQLFGPF